MICFWAVLSRRGQIVTSGTKTSPNDVAHVIKALDSPPSLCIAPSSVGPPAHEGDTSMTTANTLRNRLHRGAALTALVLAVGAAAPAFAQDTGSVTLDDVIVTAQKRSENIQEVPVSVATMGGEKLDA